VGQRLVIVKVQTPADGGPDCLVYDRTRQLAWTTYPITGPLRRQVERDAEALGVRGLGKARKVFYQARVNAKRVHLVRAVPMEEW
jgi:hypothetical protein